MKASHATNKRLQHEHKQCKTNSKKNVTMYLFSNTLLQCLLKPLSRLPNVPKVLYVWDILIFQAVGTSSNI